MARRKTHDEFISELLSVKGTEYTALEKYTSYHEKLKVVHHKCGHIYKVSPASILSGKNCPKCAGRIKMTHNVFEERLNELVGNEYTIKSNVNSSSDKVLLKHNDCSHEYKVNVNSFLNGRRCPNCSPSKPLTQRTFAERVKNLTSDEYTVLGKYKNNRTKIEMIHEKCGRKVWISPDNFLTGHRCGHCSGKYNLTTEEYVGRVKGLVGKEYKVIGEYVNTYTKIAIKHVVCGYVWKVLPNNFVRVGTRCPKCNESKGEKRIANYFDYSFYNYKTQYRIDECRYKLPLPFDFAIFHKDELLCLIEYEGEQHFEPVDVWGGESNLKVIQKRDEIKRDYCKSNNIPLIEIPYWEEDIEGILQSELNKIHQMNNIKYEQLSMFN